MRYNVGQLITDVDRKLHTGGAALTQDFFGALDEGRRNLIGKIQPPELTRVAFMEQALYDQIDRYAAPSDLQYDNVTEIKKLSSRFNVDTLTKPLEQVYLRRFDQKRQLARNIFNVHHENGIKYMRIHDPRGLKQHEHILINEADSLTQNGNWNVGGNLVNLTIDHFQYIKGKGSLRFDLNNSGTTGFIETFNMKPVSIYDYLNEGSVFTWIYIPEFNSITSVKITLGSSLTDYYYMTVNQPHDNNQFTNEWNLLSYVIQNMQTTGNPNPKNITYLRFDITTTGVPIYACRIDNIMARKGFVYQVTYGSAFCIIDPVTLLWKQIATQNSDLIPLEEDSYQLLMLETAKVVQYEAFGNGFRTLDDVNKIEAELQAKYLQYKRLHKDESIAPMQSSYVFGEMYSGYTDDPLDDSDGWGDGGGFGNSGIPLGN